MIHLWTQLLNDAELLDAAARCDDFADAAAVMRLRKMADAERVRAAIELTIARRKAVDKFGEGRAARIVADAAGVEQASSLDVATHKAKRFAEAGVDSIIDLCCGIGGDAIALRDVAHTMCIDRDEARAWMAHRNANCPAACADVTRLRLGGRAYHIDPDRRPGGRRVWRLEDCEPGPAFLHTLGGDGAIKLSPGVDFDQLSDLPGEIEIINRRGTLVQALLWRGKLARHHRTATRIDHGGVVQLHGSPRHIPLTEPGRYLFAIDPAIERAELIGVLCDQLNIAAIHRRLGLLTAASPIDSPWLTGFELLANMPWHPSNTRRVRDALAEHDAGVVEVKTRGKAVDPDRVAEQLRGDGRSTLTVFILRTDRKLTAWITRRL